MSRRPSISSITSSGFHPSRSASPAFSTSTFEPQYGGARPIDRLRMQAGHVQTFPYTSPAHDSSVSGSHTGGKASKKKREDRKQYSKRATTGTNSSRVRKSDNEAGNRYCQAIDMAELAQVLRQSNSNIDHTAAPRNGNSAGWILLKANNIAGDVRQDGIEPSRWNKSSVNGSAILVLDQSNALLDDVARYFDGLQARASTLSPEQLIAESTRWAQTVRACKDSRGEADYRLFSERLTNPAL